MEQERRRSLLGAYLNTVYEPCSVAAAELVRAVHSSQEVILRDADYPERIIVSDLNTPVQTTVRAVELKNSRTEKDPTYGDTRTVTEGTGFYLSQDVVIEKVPIEMERKEFRTFRKPKKIPYTTIKEQTHFGDIWLAAGVLGGKILMPLATFQDRTDGQCKYVQIGPEINDDTVFAVQGDESESRLELIDHMRALFPREGKRVASDELMNFVDSLKIRSAKSLAIAICAHINKETKNTENVVDGDKSLTVLENGQITHYDKVREFKKYPGYRAREMREDIERLRMYEVGEGEQTRLICGLVRRGKVMRPILEVVRDTGEHQFIEADHLSDLDKYRAATIIAEQFVDSFGEDPHDEYRRILGEDIERPEKFLREKFRFGQMRKPGLEVKCMSQERLVSAIGEKAIGVTYGGTVRDVYMEVTDGDVSGTITVDRFGDIHQVKIKAKPDSLTDVEVTDLISFEFDPTESLEDRLPSGPDAEDFLRLVEGFNTAVPSPTSTAE